MSLFPSSFSFDSENICQPLKTMSDHIVKLLKVHQNCVSSTLLSVFGNVFRQSFVFDYYFQNFSTVLNNFGGSLSEKQVKHLLFFFFSFFISFFSSRYLLEQYDTAIHYIITCYTSGYSFGNGLAQFLIENTWDQQLWRVGLITLNREAEGKIENHWLIMNKRQVYPYDLNL